MQNGIVKESVRVSIFNLTAGKIDVLSFSGKHPSDKVPNIFQIRNQGNDTCYISRDPNVAADNYEVAVAGNGGTRVYVYPPGTLALHAISVGNISISVNSMYAETVQPYDLDETSATTIINNTLTESVEITGTLPAGANNIGKVDIASFPRPTAASVQVVDIVLANTQYSINLVNAKRFSVSLRGASSDKRLRLSYTAGTVAAPVEPYYEYGGDTEYFEEGILFTGTLYIACNTAGQKAQVIIWQ